MQNENSGPLLRLNISKLQQHYITHKVLWSGELVCLPMLGTHKIDLVFKDDYEKEVNFEHYRRRNSIWEIFFQVVL